MAGREKEAVEGTAMVPYRTRDSEHLAIASAWATAWPRLYRQVFALIDGQRSMERIAELLRKTPDLIEEITNELLASGYVALQSPTEELIMHASLLRASYDLISTRKEEFAEAFYKRLFIAFPQTRPLFAKTAMKRQRSSLMATLTVIVNAVEKGDRLAPTLQRLGERHHAYGVKPEYYPLVEQVLLETFNQLLGANWTPAFQMAWTLAYRVIVKLMIESGKQETEGASAVFASF